MADKKNIAKLKRSLKHNDVIEISKRSGFSTVSVSKFFNGKSHLMAEETQMAIITSTLEVIKERKERELAVNESINAILG